MQMYFMMNSYTLIHVRNSFDLYSFMVYPYLALMYDIDKQIFVLEPCIIHLT
jgi:hypothetical protein